MKALRRYLQDRPVTEDDEFAALCDALALDPTDHDDPLVIELRRPAARNLARAQRPCNQGPLARAR